MTETMTESPYDYAQFVAVGLTLSTLEPGVTYTLVRNNDNSDHGRAECFFADADDASRYVTRLKARFDAGPMGDHFHPGPGSLDITIYTVVRQV